MQTVECRGRCVGPPSIQFHKHNWGWYAIFFSILSSGSAAYVICQSMKVSIKMLTSIPWLVWMNMVAGCVVFSIGLRAYSVVCLYLFIQYIYRGILYYAVILLSICFMYKTSSNTHIYIKYMRHIERYRIDNMIDCMFCMYHHWMWWEVAFFCSG